MPERAPSTTAPNSAQISLAHPLDEFYAEAGEPLPPLAQVDGAKVPEPYRTLLVHQNDMTPTLESFYEARVHLDVLGRRRKDNAYFREVILRLDDCNEPVEFGAIKINLALFTPESREQILKESLPLGRILSEFKIAHTSRPRAYLRLDADKLISRVLGLNGAKVVFGRRNTLYDPQQRPLAEIVEILPVSSKKD